MFAYLKKHFSMDWAKDWLDMKPCNSKLKWAIGIRKLKCCKRVQHQLQNFSHMMYKATNRIKLYLDLKILFTSNRWRDSLFLVGVSESFPAFSSLSPVPVKPGLGRFAIPSSKVDFLPSSELFHLKSSNATTLILIQVFYPLCPNHGIRGILNTFWPR